jgi:hypothetical protein
MSSSPLPDIAKRLHPITTIALRSAAMIVDEVNSFGAEVLPGSLLFTTIGAPANEKIPKWVVMEKDVFGQTVHDKYKADERVFLLYPQPGDIVALRLKDNTEVNTMDFVVPTANGCVVPFDATGIGTTDNEAAIIGLALTDLDLTGGNQGKPNLIPVLIM